MLIANIEDGLRTLCAWLCNVIYWLVGGIFELFINVSKVQLLSSDNIKQIYQRVTIILAIVMVFYVTFELVKYVVQPDQMTDKEKGADKVVMKMLIVVLLIAFVPTIFSYSYKLQNIIIEKEVLSKLILGKSNANTVTYGRDFSADVFQLFYKYDKDFWKDPNGTRTCEGVSYENIVLGNLEAMRTDGWFGNLSHCLNKTDTETKGGIKSKYYLISFNGLFALIVGAFLVYVLVLYCVDIGRRVAQLAFLQVIAPIPIIGYLSPKKENIFTKWVKQCLTTYLDLFIRLAIIYFVLLICSIISTAYNDGTLFNNISPTTSQTLIYIVLIMGLLLFAQKAPKMLEELFPKMGAAAGNLGLKAGERVAPLAARTIGLGLGAARVGIRAGIARGRNVRKRNKDLKEKLRAEGKHVDRRSMSEARREARQQKRQTQRDYKKRTKQLDTADKRLADAERDVKFSEKQLEKAKKGNDSGQIKHWEEQLAHSREKHRLAKEQYESVKNGGNASSTTARVEANERLRKARENLNAEKDKKAKAMANGTYNTMTDDEKKQLDENIKKAENEHKIAEDAYLKTQYQEDTLVSKKTRDNLNQARKNYEAVMNDGSKTDDDKRIAKENLEAAERQYLAEFNSGYDASRRTYDDARSALATERNQTYGAYAGVQAVGAGLRGVVTGAAAGFKTTKLGDIHKNIGEGLKTSNTRENVRSQYLQDGGSATFTGNVDRAIVHQQQQMGIRTASDRIKEEIKHIEDSSKSIGAQAAMEETMRTSKDEAKDRSSKKIEAHEQKIRAGDDLGNVKAADGSTLVDWTSESWYKGKTTSDIYQEFERRESEAVSRADAANQALARARADGTVKQGQEEEAARLSREAEKAKNTKTHVLKALAEYGVTKALQGDSSDAVLANKIANVRAAVENNRNHAKSRQYVLDTLEDRYRKGVYGLPDSDEARAKYIKYRDAFINNDIRDWDTADQIEGILTGHVNTLKNDQRSLQEQVRAIQENAATDAANAAAAAGGGKK